MMEEYFVKEFKENSILEDLHWLNPPARYEISGGKLVVESKPKTDFWNTTFYGFVRHDGHFLHLNLPNSEDFVITTKLTSKPVNQYDQAGLMIRYSNTCWLKTSVEFEPGNFNHLGAVVTNQGFSDWSTQNFPKGKNQVSFRIRKLGKDFIVEFSSEDSEEWSQLRMARLLEDAEQFQAGIYCCSPTGANYTSEFQFLHVFKGKVETHH